MEIKVEKDKILRHYDTGGAIRKVECTISVSDNLSSRLQRQMVIYETLGACLGYTVSGQERDMITEALMDALDQIEPLGGNDD